MTKLIFTFLLSMIFVQMHIVANQTENEQLYITTQSRSNTVVIIERTIIDNMWIKRIQFNKFKVTQYDNYNAGNIFQH